MRNIMKNEKLYVAVGKILQKAMRTKRDAPALAVMEFMQREMNEASEAGVAPDFVKIFRDSKRIWDAVLEGNKYDSRI